MIRRPPSSPLFPYPTLSRSPPTVTANGVYQFRGGKNTHLEVTVDGGNGMDYDFLGKTLPFDRVSGRLLFTNDRLQIDIRSEEHTSELQSHLNLVCRLLLAKK